MGVEKGSGTNGVVHGNFAFLRPKIATTAQR